MVRDILNKLSVAFAAGCFGGLLNSLVVWVSGTYGLSAALGVKLMPVLTPDWLYPRIVWGGLWGWLFLIPWKKSHPVQRGLLFSLGPTLVMLLVVFPGQLHKGYLGLELGLLTPLLVVVFNAVWGLGTAAWLRWVHRRS
jgi:hypothetical protein